MASRSNPSAMPPCGGAPFRSAPRKNPNFSCASSGVRPQGEDLGLDDRVVTADGPSAAFLAVDDQVIRLGPHLGRLGVKQMQVFKEGHRERMVLGDEPLFLRIPAEEREPDDPRIMK